MLMETKRADLKTDAEHVSTDKRRGWSRVASEKIKQVGQRGLRSLRRPGAASRH